MKAYNQLVSDLTTNQSAAKLATWIDTYPNQVCLNPTLLDSYFKHAKEDSLIKIEDALSQIDKLLYFPSNNHSVEVWMSFFQFLNELEDVYASLPDKVAAQDLETKREAKQIKLYERAIENIGSTHIGAAKIWASYIDFETMRNNLAKVNLLCFKALETPMQNNTQILTK